MVCFQRWYIKDVVVGVMDDHGELNGSLLKMLTLMCGEMPENVLHEMSGQWADVIVTMISEYCGRLDMDSLYHLIHKAIPVNISDGEIDSLTFGDQEHRGILAQIIFTLSNTNYDYMDRADKMVAAAVQYEPLYKPPDFFLVILKLYQEWSRQWKEANPDDENHDSASSRSRSPEAYDASWHSEPGHGSRSHSRQPSEGPSGGYARTPSRPPPGAPPRARSRDSRGCRGFDNDAKMSNVSDLLLQMKTMYSQS